MNKAGISVIIPNYNGAALLPEILPALYVSLQNSGLPYEVIISDDCSTDDSINYLKQFHPSVKLIQHPSNRGFAPTINLGIHAAIYTWVMLLNSDVKLEPDYFTHLLRYMNDETCFGVMGRIIGWDDDGVQDGGKYPSFQGFKIKTNRNYLPLNEDLSTDWPSMYLSGANAFVNKEKLLLLGGFDEIFAPFYVEDFELSLRAWRMGWSCYYEHRSICRHRTSITIKRTRNKRFIKTVYNRNKFFLHAIHLDGLPYYSWWMQLMLELLFRSLLLQFYFINSFIEFAGKMKLVRQSRKKLATLAEKENHPLFTVKQVIKQIHQALDNRSIRLF